MWRNIDKARVRDESGKMSWIRSILDLGSRAGRKLVGSDLKGNQYFEKAIKGGAGVFFS